METHLKVCMCYLAIFLNQTSLLNGVWLDVTNDKHHKYTMFAEIELHLQFILKYSQHSIVQHN